jgi:hypothetical protein
MAFHNIILLVHVLTYFFLSYSKKVTTGEDCIKIKMEMDKIENVDCLTPLSILTAFYSRIFQIRETSFTSSPPFVISSL